jgi:hypothetical protein
MGAPAEQRRCWTFVQQRGICYLQITPLCRAIGGEMRIEGVRRNEHPRHASWEHLYARGRKLPEGVSRAECILLACRECNQRKGSDEIATKAQVAYAMQLAAIWAHIAAGMEHEAAFTAAGVAFVMVEECPAIAAVLRVELDCADDGQPWIVRDGEKMLTTADPRAIFSADRVYQTAKQRAKAKRRRKKQPPFEATPSRSVAEAMARRPDPRPVKTRGYRKNPTTAKGPNR